MADELVLFKPFPKQEEFLEAALSGKYHFILYGGAIRGGKTFCLLALFIFLARLFPGSRWAIVRRDEPTIKKNLYPSWDKIKPSNYIVRSNLQTHTFTFKNGSQIIFFPESFDTDKELNRWRGLEVNGIGFEEINECQEVSFEKAFERAGTYIIRGKDVPQPPIIVVATCNPTDGWVKEKIYDRWKDGTLPESWLYIPSRIYDNEPLLKAQPGYIAGLKASLTKLNFEKFVNGDWDIQLKTGGEFYKSFEMEAHVKPTQYNPKLPLLVSWDDNVHPYLPCGIYQAETKKTVNNVIISKELRMIDEITGVSPRNTVRDVCNEIIRKFPGHTAGMLIFGDHTADKEDTKLEKGERFYSLIIKYLWMYKPNNRVTTNPSVRMRGNWINTVFEKEVGKVKIIIGENCKHTITDLIKTKEAGDGTKLKEMATDPKTNVRYQKNGHFTDILDYVACSVFALEFLQYQRGGYIPLPQTGKNKSIHSY